jgi:hypothetical protein
MAISNRKLSCSLPHHLYNQFKAWKVKQGIATDSKALIEIVEQFLSFTPPESKPSGELNGEYATKAEVQLLMGKLMP